MEAHVATLKEQLAASEARLEKRDARHTADLAAERARTEKAIAAFESLAQRIEAMPRPSDRGSRKGNDRAYDRPNEGTFIKAPGNKRPPLGLRASAFARLTTSGRPARRHRSLRRYELVDTFYDAAVSGADPASERSGFGQMLERFARDLMQLAGHDI